MKKFLLGLLLSVVFVNISVAEEIAANIDDQYVQQLVAENQYSELQKLLQQGLDVNSRDAQGETLLFYAIMSGAQLKIVRLLIESGADVNAPSMNSGMTPLLAVTLTAAELQEQALQIYQQDTLPERQSMVEARLKQQMQQQMLRAAKILKLLLDSGADVNQETPFGTPLMSAAGNEWNLKMIDMLINAGANVNQQDRNGRTALFYASINDADKVVSKLLAAGADINIKDYTGKTYMEITKQDMQIE